VVRIRPDDVQNSIKTQTRRTIPSQTPDLLQSPTDDLFKPLLIGYLVYEPLTAYKDPAVLGPVGDLELDDLAVPADHLGDGTYGIFLVDVRQVAEEEAGRRLRDRSECGVGDDTRGGGGAVSRHDVA